MHSEHTFFSTLSSAIELWYVWPVAALLCGIVALAPLGHHVLKRGVVFIDLAVAQAAAAAALWVGAVIDHPSLWTYQFSAALGAMVCATCVAALTRYAASQREAMIGLLYVIGACTALLAARQNPHGRERMAELLAADVLWVLPWQVASLGIAACVVLALRRSLHRDAWFYPVFALVASLAVPTLGLLLVFAALIAPALWQMAGASALHSRLAAFMCAMIGLALSGYYDIPSGASVAIALGFLGVSRVFWRAKSL